MVTREILESHPVSTLKKEIGKTNIRGYSKLGKKEIIDLMLENKERFDHIKMRLKPPPGVKKTVSEKPKTKRTPEERKARLEQIALNQEKRTAKAEAKNFKTYRAFLNNFKSLFEKIKEAEVKKGVSKKGAEGVARNEFRKLYGNKSK